MEIHVHVRIAGLAPAPPSWYIWPMYTKSGWSTTCMWSTHFFMCMLKFGMRTLNSGITTVQAIGLHSLVPRPFQQKQVHAFAREGSDYTRTYMYLHMGQGWNLLKVLDAIMTSRNSIIAKTAGPYWMVENTSWDSKASESYWIGWTAARTDKGGVLWDIFVALPSRLCLCKSRDIPTSFCPSPGQ